MMNLNRVLISKKAAYRLAIITLVVLLIPLVAMQLTNEVSWQVGDFVVAAILLIGFGYMYEVISKNLNSGLKKAIVGLVVLAMFVFVWVVLAVDLI